MHIYSAVKLFGDFGLPAIKIALLTPPALKEAHQFGIFFCARISDSGKTLSWSRKKKFVVPQNFFWGPQNFLQLCAINLGEFRKLVRNAG
jgi:hypothetical protein